MKSVSRLLVKSITLLVIISLISTPLALTAHSADFETIPKNGFTAHGFEAFPSYAFPSYAFPSYAFPSYAFPSYAFPSYAFPSYAFNDGVTDYNIGMWGLEKIFPTVDENYKLDQLASDTKYGNHIHVAVLDTGIYLHSEINNVVWTYDATGNNDMTDVSGHGTHVAGIVSSFDIADIYAIKVMDGPNMQGEWAWLEDGIYAAIQGPDGAVGTFDDADIINLSLGSMGEIPPSYIQTAIAKAYKYNVAVVASAGNSGDGDISSDDLVQYPAAYSTVIAVGATDVNDNLASFSNTNSYVEVTAPGVDILAPYKNGEYAVWSGTSMAAAYASGVLAYMMFNHGTGAQHFIPLDDRVNNHLWDTVLNAPATVTLGLKSLLHMDCIDLGTAGLDNGFGYGLVQYTP